MIEDQLPLIIRAVEFYAWATIALASSVVTYTVVAAVGYWIEYRSWKDGRG